MQVKVYMRYYSIGKWVIAVVLLGYMFIGCFPFAPIEGDSTAISNGAEYMIDNGIQDNFFSYRYHAQPGTYALITWFSRISGFSAYISFSIISLIAAIGFIGISVILLARYAGTSIIDSMIFLLFFQEVFAETYYPSSTVLAGFMAIAAFLLLQRDVEKTNLIASILFAAAVWIRFDVILCAPLFIVQLFGANPAKRVKRSVLLVLSVIVILLLYHLSHANLLHMIGSAQQHMQQEYQGTTGIGLSVLGKVDIKSHLSLFSVFLLIAFISGMVRCAKEKPNIFFSILIGMIPFYLIFMGKITTPKYFYYYIPLYALPAFIYIKRLLVNRKPLLLLIISITLFQYIIGVRISFKSKPHRTVPYPTIVQLGSISTVDSDINEIGCVIGAGAPIPTADFYRLSSGVIFAPVFWRHCKQTFHDHLKMTQDFISQSKADSLTIITTRYSGFQTAFRLLTDMGFRCIHKERSENDNQKTCLLSNGNTHIELTKWYYDNSVYKQKSIEPLRSIIFNKGVSNTLFFSTAPWEQYLFSYRFEGFRQISQFAFQFDIKTLSVL